MQHKSTLLLAAVLSALFLVSTAVLAVFYFYAPPPASSFKLEIAKAILQLGVVSVVGAAVSILVFKYQNERAVAEQDKERHRKNIEYREDLLKGTLARAMASYNSVKKARRLLRARAIVVRDSTDYVLAAPYDTYMEIINDSQFEFENLAQDVETFKRAFSSPQELVDAFRTMEHFLGDMFTEYEKLRKDFHGGAPGKKLDEFNELPAFIGPFKKQRFATDFANPFHQAQRAIRRDLLHPQLADVSKTETVK